MLVRLLVLALYRAFPVGRICNKQLNHRRRRLHRHDHHLSSRFYQFDFSRNHDLIL
jgi:hypothetical protein